VLGVKLEYLRRAVTQFSHKAHAGPSLFQELLSRLPRLWLEGTSSTVCTLSFRISLAIGPSSIMDELKHSGWNMLTASIISDPRNPHLMQKDPALLADREGIFITEFLIEFDPLETYGSYYFYIDKLFARQTSLPWTPGTRTICLISGRNCCNLSHVIHEIMPKALIRGEPFFWFIWMNYPSIGK
jgi:hypothetical protein